MTGRNEPRLYTTGFCSPIRNVTIKILRGARPPPKPTYLHTYLEPVLVGESSYCRLRPTYSPPRSQKTGPSIQLWDCPSPLLTGTTHNPPLALVLGRREPTFKLTHYPSHPPLRNYKHLPHHRPAVIPNLR